MTNIVSALALRTLRALLSDTGNAFDQAVMIGDEHEAPLIVLTWDKYQELSRRPSASYSGWISTSQPIVNPPYQPYTITLSELPCSVGSTHVPAHEVPQQMTGSFNGLTDLRK